MLERRTTRGSIVARTAALATLGAAVLAATALARAVSAETPTPRAPESRDATDPAERRLLLSAESTPPPPPPDPAIAAARATLERLRTLRAERPRDGLLPFVQAMQHATLGEREAALRELRSLVGRRLGLIPVEGFGFDALWRDPGFQRVRGRLAAEERRVVSGTVLHRLPDPALVPEGIAYDAASRRFFLGSAFHRIVSVDARGQVGEFVGVAADLDVVLGLYVDAPRDRLCAVTTNAFENSGRENLRNAVACFGLADGRPRARILAPEAAQLNDLVIAPDGTVYATDSGGGSVLRAPPGAERFVSLGDPGAMRGANGIALATDGTLYVAMNTGIARVDPATGATARLPQPDDVVTGGIDGLYWHEGDLLGVQNVFNPARVIRVHLSGDGARIEGLKVLQSRHHPSFDEPTTGTIVGDRLVVIANSYVSRYQPDGTLRHPETMRGTDLLAIPLR